MSLEYINKIEKKFLPHLFFNKEKKARHVGVEIEYSNLSLEKSIELARELFGGEIQKNSKYEWQLTQSKYGDFNFELDAQLLQKIQKEGLFEKLQHYIGDVSHDIDTLLDKTSKRFVPFEVATPPVPISNLFEIDKLAESFCLQGAFGTTHSLHYAFGVHFNIEPASLESIDVLKTFKAFLILQKWIEVQSEVDIARKISPYINDFPKEYLKKVIDKEYQPNQEPFIEEYIAFNPTRNRILDMLPLMTFWDEKRVRKHLPKEKINARPTFHYRLANSKVNILRWSLTQEFLPWVVVELLVANPKKFEIMSEEFLTYLEAPIFNTHEWIEQCHFHVLDLLSS